MKHEIKEELQYWTEIFRELHEDYQRLTLQLIKAKCDFYARRMPIFIIDTTTGRIEPKYTLIDSEQAFATSIDMAIGYFNKSYLMATEESLRRVQELSKELRNEA